MKKAVGAGSHRAALVVVLLLAAFASLAVSPSAFAQTNRAEAYFHFSKARLLDEDGNWAEAIEEYKRALALDPENSLIYSEMAQTYWRHRMVRDAVETAEKAVAADANNIDAHKLLSDIYRSTLGATASGQQPSPQILGLAIHELEEIVRIDPSERSYVLMLARLYQAVNERDKAAEVYRQHLNIEPGSEEGTLGLAQLLLQDGDSEAAAELLEGFLRNQPDSDLALAALGDAYSNLGEHEKAVDAYRRALEWNPDETELQNAYADALFSSDQIEKAAEIYEKLVDSGDADGYTSLRLGQIYRRLMRYDLARPHMLRASDAAPNDIEVQFHMFLLDRDEGLLENALSRLTDIVKKTERANGIYSEAERGNRRVFITQLALLNTLLGQHDQAIQAFKDLRAISPDKDRIDTYIVESYRSAKNLPLAAQYLQTAMTEFPNSRPLQLVNADLIAERGRLNDGIRILETMAGGAPPNMEILATMSSMYERAEEYDDAQKVLDTALRAFPNDEEVHFMQGALYEKQKKFVEAEQAFRKALELETNYPAAQNYLGYMLAERGIKLDEAVTMIQKAVESDPTNGAYLDSLGWAYFKMERMDLAEQYLKRAVIFARTNATMYDHLGDLYNKLGRYQEAAAQWTKALELATESEESEQVKKKLDQVRGRTANR